MGVGVSVAEDVGVRVLVGVGVCVMEGVGVRVLVGVGVCVGVGVATDARLTILTDKSWHS